MHPLFARVLYGFLAFCAPAFAAAPDFASLADLVRNSKGRTAHPFGTAIAVVKDGAIVYEGYFGYADIDAQVPVTRDTVFYIASATKPFFALNALLDEDAGRLDMGMSLQQMFPDTRFAGFDPGAVTVRDLLVHTSGVDDVALVRATAFTGLHDTSSRLALVALATADDEAAHGTFRYSNVGYNILSIWMDRRFGEPWQQRLDQAILRPLGMRHTSASIEKGRADGWTLAEPYSFASARPADALYLTKSDATMHAAGGLVSTASDLARFLIAQRADGSDAPLAKAVIERSHRPQARVSSQYLDFVRSGYAWGWYSGDFKGRPMLHHFGGFAGFHAHLSFLPEDGIALVVLNNDDVLGAQLTNLIAGHVYGVLLDQPDVEAASARRFAEFETGAATLRTRAAEQREAIRARAWNLSLPRERYAGTYAHAVLGEITVALDAARQPVLRWGRLTATATAGGQRDQMRVEWVPHAGEFVAFEVADGDVAALRVDRYVFGRTH